MIIHTKIENGKAYLEFDFTEEIRMSGDNVKVVFLQLQDKEGQKVLEIAYPMNEEEPPLGLLLHPHFWNGISDPYLYQVQGYMQTAEGEIQTLSPTTLALYSLEEIPAKGCFLNGKPFEIKAVCWEWLQGNRVKGSEVQHDKRQDSGMQENIKTQNYLEQLVMMGANTICIPGKIIEEKNYEQGNEIRQNILQLCREKGFLVLNEESAFVGDCPKLSQLLLPKYPFHTDTYYLYKAKWSKIPFLYINFSSLRKNEKGVYSITVYSNQKKVALYVDGILFEFLTGAGEYFFEEIPIKKYPAVLTAESGECSTAITIYERSHSTSQKHTLK